MADGVKTQLTPVPPPTGPGPAQAWRITVNDSCVGSGCCVGAAPRHFRLDATDRSIPLNPVVAPDEAVLDAAALCPTEAIEVTDVETGDVIEF